jgi:hypothetical protein
MARPLTELIGSRTVYDVQDLPPQRLRAINDGVEDMRRRGVLIHVRVRDNVQDMPPRGRRKCRALFKQAIEGKAVRVTTGKRYDPGARSSRFDTLEVPVGQVVQLPVDTALLLLNRDVPALIFEEVDDGRPGTRDAVGNVVTQPLKPGDLARVESLETALLNERVRNDKLTADLDDMKAMLAKLLDNQPAPTKPGKGRRKG